MVGVAFVGFRGSRGFVDSGTDLGIYRKLPSMVIVLLVQLTYRLSSTLHML